MRIEDITEGVYIKNPKNGLILKIETVSNQDGLYSVEFDKMLQFGGPRIDIPIPAGSEYFELNQFIEIDSKSVTLAGRAKPGMRISGHSTGGKIVEIINVHSSNDVMITYSDMGGLITIAVGANELFEIHQ